MKELTVYGPGCSSCQELYKRCFLALDKAGVQGKVGKVERLEEMAAAGVMLSPGLAVDGKLVSQGKLLAVSQIVRLLEG